MATEYEYIIDSATLKQRYDRICSIIDGLELAQLANVSNADTLSYSLDDGQTRISTQYRSPEQIQKAIDAYEKIKIRLEQKLTGTRIIRLADAESIQSNNRNF